MLGENWENTWSPPVVRSVVADARSFDRLAVSGMQRAGGDKSFARGSTAPPPVSFYYQLLYFSDPVVDGLVDKQSATADPDARRAMVQEADLITSNKVAAAFLYHPIDPMVWRKEVNFPEESRIPGLVDLDRVTLSS